MLEGYTEKSRTSIQRSDLNTFGVLKPIVGFNTLIDIDVGLLIAYGRENRSLPFYQKYGTMNLLTRVVYGREKENPFTLLYSDKDERELNGLYAEWMKNKYDLVLKYSIPTEIISLIGIWRKLGSVKTAILCRSQQESDYISQFRSLSQCNKIIIDKDLNLMEYQQYYFKSAEDDYIHEAVKTIGAAKTVYIANYKFNLLYHDELAAPILSPSIEKVYEGRGNKISIIDLYNRKKLYGEE